MAKEGAEKVADAAAEMSFPRDLRREGGSQYGETLRIYGLPENMPSETARAQFKQRVLQGLGVPVSSGC